MQARWVMSDNLRRAFRAFGTPSGAAFLKRLTPPSNTEMKLYLAVQLTEHAS